MKRSAYDVSYRLHYAGEIKRISVVASNKAEAYDTAVYEDIVRKENTYPYSAWVVGVTHKNGRYQKFNTSEGNPY